MSSDQVPSQDNPLGALDPEKVYAAIERGAYRALSEALAHSYNVKATGDRLADAVQNGAAKAFAEGLRTASTQQGIGDNLLLAVEKGAAAALSGKR